MENYKLTCHVISENYIMLYSVIRQGIDARLTAFTQSKFELIGRQLHCEIHPEEMEILIRRLIELEYQYDNYLADDIVCSYYGVEIV